MTFEAHLELWQKTDSWSKDQTIDSQWIRSFS